MSIRWFDSHCHVQERYLEAGDPLAELGPTLRRAWLEGVEEMVCVGTDGPASRQALALARASQAGQLGEEAPLVWATVGQHPHEASAGTEEVVSLVEELVGEGRAPLVAVGECGLDYHYDHSPRPAQRAVFAEQVGLARRVGLPLVIHARQAWDDLFAILEDEGLPGRAVLHCFTGGPAELERCLEAGLVVSFSGIVTFKKAEEVRQAALDCPLERMLIETDSPFLAPVPHRGKRNEPAHVALVGRAVAALKGCPPEQVAEATRDNARRFFALDGRPKER